MIMKRKPRTLFRNITPTSSREDVLHVLSLGGAGGHYGFGRYPEGIFASVRHMVIVRAK